ncbi:hypothetical protein HOF92_16555, partial [bacterium]|nr:hypothetical protein [bacterium]
MHAYLTRRRALSIIEVVVSLTILVVVIGTYGSATQGRRQILRTMQLESLYQRLAMVQLERVLLFIHSGKREEKNFISTAKSDVSTIEFQSFTEIFSHEGKSSGLDALQNSGEDPRIDLLQLEVHGTNHGSDYYDDDDDTRFRFLSFPYPNELKFGYDHSDNNDKISNHTFGSERGTFHHVTSQLRDTDYRSVLPLVSEEFLVTLLDEDGNVAKDSDGKVQHFELGYSNNAKLSPDEVQLDAGVQLFLNPTVIGAWNNERIRRYVYYRKIREGNLVYRDNVRGRGVLEVSGSSLQIATSTDIDLLFIQSLKDWNSDSGSSNGGNVSGVSGAAYPETVGGAGAHAILVMVVVRTMEEG